MSYVKSYVMNKNTIFSITLICLLNAGLAFSRPDAQLDSAINNVSPNAIKASMTFLADDLAEGRGAGTRGFAIASKYVESQFIAMGLQPGIDGKSYVQPVPFRKGVVDEKGSSVILITNGKKETLVVGKDFLLSPYYANPLSEIKAPLVFVGYGVSAPELGHDDYDNIDVKGKIVVYLN